MTLERPRTLLLVLLGAAVAFAPVGAQSLAPDAATPRGPLNPFTPPACTGAVFTDVTCSSPFDAWIEQYAADQITGGCGGGNYCPGNPVTRAQMAVFVEKAMRGTGAWSPGDLGHNNTGLGSWALLNNTTAGSNTAIGSQALMAQSYNNGGSPWASSNTAIGTLALWNNQPTSPADGRENVAVGATAMANNTTGAYNTAVGTAALVDNDSAINNTAIGWSSLNSNTTGFDNTSLGYLAGARGGSITGYGGSTVVLVPNQTGNYDTFLGITGATAQVDNCTAVGMDAYCDANNQVRLGNVFVNSIGGKVAWSALSDGRAKTDVRDLDRGLDLVLSLRPVAYRYKSGNGGIDMGFVAQDVEAVLGDGYNVVDVGGDADRTLSLRYSELIAPLVRAVQEQQSEIRGGGSRIEELEALVRAQQARLDALELQVEALLGRGATTTASAR